jgi:hypothetical protein
MDLKDLIGGCVLDSYSSGQGSVAAFCEDGSEPCASIKGGECVDELSDCSIFSRSNLYNMNTFY